jgi:hypothetical protein
MVRRIHPIAGIILLCQPGIVAVAIDGCSGFVVCRAMFTDALGFIETLFGI